MNVVQDLQMSCLSLQLDATPNYHVVQQTAAVLIGLIMIAFTTCGMHVIFAVIADVPAIADRLPHSKCEATINQFAAF